MQEPNSPRLRIGILGTAKIARSFATGLRPSETVEVIAIASRDAAKAEAFALEFKIPTAYGSYANLLENPTVEAVYVPLPNALHAEWSIRAIEAGKHVLCEKPLAATRAEAQAMFEAARRRSVTLVEGFPYRSQPQTLKLKALTDSGIIGTLVSMHAAFGFPLTDPNNIRFDPALAGGALMDVGTYPVSLVRLLAGERPSRVYTSARWHSTGVDETLVASLEHRSGFLAQISCSFMTALHRQALIAGSAGMLQSTYWNTPPPGVPAIVQLKRGIGADSPFEDIEVPAVNGFRAEAESFARAIRLGPGHWNGATPEESLDIAATLEAILESARAGAPVEF